jgi:hypothetical protein
MESGSDGHNDRMGPSAHHLAALRDLPFHVRLIKYDPARALGQGYDDGSRTSISDIGREVGGRVLTADEYARVEQAHLDALREMATEAGVERLTLRHLTDASRPLDESLEEVRSALREELDAGLWSDDDESFYIVVGFDYHVYCGSRRECPCGLAIARARGLHPRVDDGPSPWLDDD